MIKQRSWWDCCVFGVACRLSAAPRVCRLLQRVMSQTSLKVSSPPHLHLVPASAHSSTGKTTETRLVQIALLCPKAEIKHTVVFEELDVAV